MRTKTVYLLHFHPAYVSPIGETGRTKTAGHYLGSTADLVETRLATHLSGHGSPLVAAAVAQGCQVILAGTWPGDRTTERRIKRTHHLHRWCRLCGGTNAHRAEAVRHD